MHVHLVEEIVCPQCQSVLAARDETCHQCGCPTAAVSRPASVSLGAQFGQILDNRWAVLGVLFLVTAALGLPLLWISRAFSPVAKCLLSVIVLLYTAVLLGLAWLTLAWSYGRVMQALQQFG